ncbi:hypothetical protein ACFV0D_25970 [Streptomyces sp. NPDC059556]|uniref:hypothetical protein n=1 Tax=Streptomyces sp. NPDC059556 TaxID=3346863 RepID=UPI003677209F
MSSPAPSTPSAPPTGCSPSGCPLGRTLRRESGGAYGELTDTAVEPAGAAVLTRPDGAPLGRRRVVARAARIHVQEEPFTEWAVLDLSG